MRSNSYLLTVLMVFSTVSTGLAQFQHPVLWERVLGGLKDEGGVLSLSSGFAEIKDILAIDNANNIYIILGSLSGIGGDKTTVHCGNVNQPDYWLVKLDPAGNLLWEKNIGGQNLDMPNSLLLDEARSCMYVVGTSKSPPSCSKTDTTKGKEDIWIAKLDWNGMVIWDKSYGGLEVESPRSAVLTSNGDLFCVGSSTSYLAGGGNIPSTGWTAMADMWGFMIDSSGAILWNRWIGTDTGWDYIFDTDYRNGKILLTGYTNAWQNGTRDVTSASHGLDDGWVLMLDTTGFRLWDKTLGSTKLDRFYAGVIDESGNSYITGFVDGQAQNGDVTDSLRGWSDIWLLKLDENGNTIYNKILGGDSNDTGGHIAIDGDYLYLLSSSQSDVNDQKSETRIEGYDDWIVVLDTGLNIIWDETVGIIGQELNYSRFCPSSDSGLILAKFVRDTSGGDFTLQCWDTINHTSDLWLMKFAPVTPTGLSVAEKETSLHCFPNPASTVLELGQLEQGSVVLYSMQGQLMRSWMVIPEDSRLTLPMETYPEGMYMVRNGKRQCRVVKM